MRKLLIIGAMALALAGCKTDLIKLTVYSPDKLDLSTGGMYTVDRSHKVKGMAGTAIYLVYAPDMPTYQQAFVNAMAQHPGCVGLADAKIERDSFWFLFGYCDFHAEGYPIVKKGVK